MTESADNAGELSTGPHGRIVAADDRERFTLELFDRLWMRYRERVVHVQSYESMIRDAGATFVNDHIAFRTFACQQPTTGIASLSRLFEALGYQPAGCYHFTDKHLNAIHYQHQNAQFPKLFISELKTWELSGAVQKIVQRSLESHRVPISTETLAALTTLNEAATDERSRLLNLAVEQIHQLPWQPPGQDDVTTLNQESQYAAWVLVHGYNVNHFTSLINSHGTETLDDIEKTVQALRDFGVPMKADVEGESGSKLRQSATEAAVIDVDVTADDQPAQMPWTYAYFELAERGEIADPETGQLHRFEGFLGPQATHLFEMTKNPRT